MDEDQVVGLTRLTGISPSLRAAARSYLTCSVEYLETGTVVKGSERMGVTLYTAPLSSTIGGRPISPQRRPSEFRSRALREHYVSIAWQRSRRSMQIPTYNMLIGNIETKCKAGRVNRQRLMIA